MIRIENKLCLFKETIFKIPVKILSPNPFLTLPFSKLQSNHLTAKIILLSNLNHAIIPLLIFYHRFKLSSAMKPADTEVHDLCMHLIASPLTS